MIKALSLFAGGGIGETYLKDVGIHTVVANELLKDRANIYQYRFPETDMVVGDIKANKELLIEKGKENKVELIIATPPCQGMSNIGKRDYEGDERNYLIFDVIDIIDAVKPNYVFIENVPKFLDMVYPYKKKPTLLTDILKDKYGKEYDIKYGVYNAVDYGVPQVRKRAIIRIYKKGLAWDDPEKQKPITLRNAIGHLPSIEAGEDSGIKYHYGLNHSHMHIEALKHTPTGCTALDNPVFCPKKPNGEKVRGYHNTYRRLEWDKPCPTRTMNSNSISGSNNCHPGKLLNDGTYSDARTLSLLELFIVSSLPQDMDLPDGFSEKLIRNIVGEGIPPLMTKAFFSKIQSDTFPH